MHEDKSPDQEQEKLLSELNDIMFTISQRIQPASPKEANGTLSTREFIDKIREHFPDAQILSDSDIYGLLKKYGYKYTLVNHDAGIEWLVFNV